MNTSLVSSRSPRLVKANKTEVPKCARIERERERVKGSKRLDLDKKGRQLGLEIDLSCLFLSIISLIYLFIISSVSIPVPCRL